MLKGEHQSFVQSRGRFQIEKTFGSKPLLAIGLSDISPSSHSATTKPGENFSEHLYLTLRFKTSRDADTRKFAVRSGVGLGAAQTSSCPTALLFALLSCLLFRSASLACHTFSRRLDAALTVSRWPKATLRAPKRNRQACDVVICPC